ncbi:MAG: PH domain-containing protein, partial [Planctomycetes bacterium]|nr:PH domain-containing protein [Planctomycetota bacterium]
MTDGSDLGGSAGAPPPAPAEPRILARGHLHPAILLLRLVDALRNTVALIVLGAVVSPQFLVIGLVLFLFHLGASLARYLTLEYRLTAIDLVVREGILSRQERRIPLDRIQDLAFESSLLRRALGLCVVLVETASGKGVEARLDALSRADADHLREVLLAARRSTLATAAPTAAGDGTSSATAADLATALVVAAPAEPVWLVHRTRSSDLFLRGLTDLRLSAFAFTGLAAFEFADRFGLLSQAAGIAAALRRWLGDAPTVTLALLLLGVVAGVVAIGVATATLGNLIQFHGFELVLRGSVLQRRYGLLTTRQKTLPRERVQRVAVEQSWLRRLLGRAVVKADSAGGSRAEGEDTGGGFDVVVPLTRIEQANALLPALLPGLERGTPAWLQGSRRLIVRTTLVGAVLAALALAAGLPAVGPYALFALLLIPLWAVIGMLSWQNLAWSLDDDFLRLQHGVVGRYASYVPTAKVQSVVLLQGPLAQLLGLAELTV